MSDKKYKFCDRNMISNEPRTQFWGVCCEGGKLYSQVVNQRFYITQAVLEPDPGSGNDNFVNVKMERDGFAYLLCVLQHNSIYQANLNYIFDKGEKVAFRIEGKGKVFLSGYQIADSKATSNNVSFASEGVRTSPLKVGKRQEGAFEVSSISPGKGETRLENKTVQAKTSDTPKTQKKSSKAASKEFWSALLNGDVEDDDDEEEEEDEDYVADEDGSDFDEDEDDDDLEDDMYEEIVEEDDSNDNDDNADDDEEASEKEEDAISEIKASGKRKKAQDELPQKRAKKMTSAKKSKPSEVVLIDDEGKESSTSDSSEPVEVTPKKSPVAETKSEKKKAKKKKSLEQKLAQTPEGKSPSSTIKMSGAKTLKGGVEVQDIRLGNGPIAKPGRMAHVFYVGKLADTTIFDSRTRGSKPFSFKLGAQQVIKGWEVGLEGMRVGGKRKIKIPPHMGYGHTRIEGVPPNSTLYFIVELEAVS